jgi:hypothetical protein
MVTPNEPMDMFADCVNYLLNHPTLLFVGSGVSIGFPSVLPSSWEMLHEITLPITVPANTPQDEMEAVSSALPELYYEALIEFVGVDAASLWQLLRLGQTEQELAKHKLGPNNAHLVLVYLAWRWRLPILTTNFDTMLESAAQMLGLIPVTCFDTGMHHFRVALQENEVAIWKLHGSVADINSIRTTLYTITQLNRDLFAKLSQLFEEYRACLIGYSGRDIDLFPRILEFSFPVPAFWIDPSFGPEHRIHFIHAVSETPQKFIAVRANGATLASGVLARIKDDNGPLQTLRTLVRELEPTQGPDSVKRYDIAKNQYLELAQDYAHRILDPILAVGCPERWLVHGLALASVGRNAAALPYLQLYISHPQAQPQKMCRALIVQAYSFHVLSRYQDSEGSARRAADIASTCRLRDEYGHALAAIDSALLQQHLPRLGYHDRRNTTQLIAWKMLLRLVYDVIRIRSNVLPSFNSQSTSAQIRARWAYLGHGARTAAFVQSMISALFSSVPILGELSKRLLVQWWNYFQRISERDGYAVGIASALRYIERLKPTDSQKVSAASLYSLISGYTEQALIAFDRGNCLLQTSNCLLAREEFEEALRYAQLDGNLSVMLKAYIGLKRSGAVINTDVVESILKGIQGEAYRRLEDDLMVWFCEL